MKKLKERKAWVLYSPTAGYWTGRKWTEEFGLAHHYPTKHDAVKVEISPTDNYPMEILVTDAD